MICICFLQTYECTSVWNHIKIYTWLRGLWLQNNLNSGHIYLWGLAHNYISGEMVLFFSPLRAKPRQTSLFFVFFLSVTLFFIFIFYLKNYFGLTACHVGSWFPDQGLNPCPLQWKLRVLTTVPPGKFLQPFSWHIFFSSSSFLWGWSFRTLSLVQWASFQAPIFLWSRFSVLNAVWTLKLIY